MLKYAKIIRVFILVAVFLLMATGLTFACGPWFDGAYLVRGSKEQFLSMPEGYFLYELERIVGHKKVKREDGDQKKNTADKDILDLKEFLRNTNLSVGEKQKVLASYSYARTSLLFSDEIPEEFVLYTKGAIAYHENDFKKSIMLWKELLDLPENKRKYKTVWASYMIGKSYLSTRKLQEAIEYFQKTRDYADKGYKDSLDLSDESYGWQALAEYKLRDYASSIHHYLKQLDVVSLSWLCGKIFALDDYSFEKIINDDISRKVLIAWAVSRSPRTYWHKTIDSNPKQNIYNKLLKAVSKMEKQNNINNADRIAWVFYNHGDFINTEKWIRLSDKESPLAQWIKSKLFLRQGKTVEAIEILNGLIVLFNKNQEWNMFYKNDKDNITRTIYAEIGLLQLRRQDYIVAFNTLINGGAYWEDIAYMAEKVLTTEELGNYLKQKPRGGLSVKLEWYYSDRLDNPTVYNSLRYLLARRFVRNGNQGKALEYMPISFRGRHEKFNLREKAKMLFDHLDKGEDNKLSRNKRAGSFFEAALIMRKYGMELAGTELDPDWLVFDGGYAYDDTMEQRFGIITKSRKEYYKGWNDEHIERLIKRQKEIKAERDFFAGSQDEEKRALSSLPDPVKRFHYRFKAADLMWQCSKLLPDNNELKARALCIGGSYIKVRDSQEADKFYKALVCACSETALGKKADKLRWFPEIEDVE